MLPKIKAKKNLNILATTLLFVGALASIPEIFFYRGVLVNNTGISIEYIFATLFLLFLFARIFLKFSVSEKFFYIYVFILMPILVGLSIIISLVDTFTYPNFIYSKLHIDSHSLFDVSFLFLALVPVFTEVRFIKKHWRWTFFTAGIFLFYFFVLLKWRFGSAFYWLDGEDGFTEYIQFFLYVGSSLLSLLSFRIVRKLKIKKNLRMFWLTVLVLSALGLFVVAMEEVSWTQRIFDIETPGKLVELNKQGEANIHNIEGIFDRVYDGYLLISIYGIFSWLAFYLPLSVWGIKLRDYLKLVLSRWYLMPYFLVMIGYIIWRYNGSETGYHLWEETSELFFSVGVSMIFLRGYIYLRRQLSTAV